MSEQIDPKGEGRGRGRWTARGVQASQQEDIENLKALVGEMAARLDAFEAGQDPDAGAEQPASPETTGPDVADVGEGA